MPSTFAKDAFSDATCNSLNDKWFSRSIAPPNVWGKRLPSEAREPKSASFLAILLHPVVMQFNHPFTAPSFRFVMSLTTAVVSSQSIEDSLLALGMCTVNVF